MTSLPDWLHQRANASPDRRAVIASGERLTYAALDARVLEMAGWLRALGATLADRIAVLLPNGLPFATLLHGVSRAEGVLVPLNARLTPAELNWQLTDVAARFLICDQTTAEQAHAAAQGLSYLRVVQVDQFLPHSGVEPSRFDLDAPHSILYTSGTTGQPKGAVLTFGNYWWSAIGSALNLGSHRDDVWLACLPLFHVGGLSILLRSVIYGITTVVHETFDPVELNKAIDEEGVTIVSMVATMLERTLEARGGRPFPARLRCVLLGGGSAPRALLEECARRNVPVSQTYGLTEAASQVATLAPEEALRKLGSAGKPLMSTELRIDLMADSHVGEIVIRGPTVTPGYWNDPESTAHAIRDGWFHTGDIGYLDDEGFLYMLDRRDDLIISGGENIYPAEIENVLRSHPAVVEAGVTGVADERWGKVAIAYVVTREAITNSDLRAFCESRLARFKIPVHFHFVESLPRNAAGKLLRRVLAEQWGSA